MFGLRIKALKDDARVLGLILKADHELDIDITPEQVDAMSAAVASGDIEILSGGDVLKPAKAAPVIDISPKSSKGK